MAEKKGLRQWLWEQRRATRLAWLLQMVSRLFTSLTNLFWIRMLVGSMGDALNGLHLAFQSIVQFGGVGDFGMGGAVNLRTGQALGEGKLNELQNFLAVARGLFLSLAVIAFVGMFTIGHSQWLTQKLGFEEIPGSGPMPQLFMVGGVLMAATLLFAYTASLNYACGNVVWPILPDLLLLQFTLCGHWLLARNHQPLWVQYSPYLVASFTRLLLSLFYVSKSHPELAKLLPISFDRKLTFSLFESSFWISLCTLGTYLYRNTDNLVINKGFVKGDVVGYTNNYKLCDLAVTIALTASFVSLPKITQWMSSPDPNDQARVRSEMRRLNQFQTLLGCAAALSYLWGNDLFMKVWWAHAKNPVLPATLALQLAFALNLVVTTCGDAGIQLALRSGKGGLRVTGAVVGLSGLLNLGLSIVAMKMQSLWGIALATAIAQSVLSLIASFYVCRYLKLNWLPWLAKGWLIPVVGICFAGLLRLWMPLDSALHYFCLAFCYIAMLAAAAWALGLDWKFLKDELKILKKLFPR